MLAQPASVACIAAGIAAPPALAGTSSPVASIRLRRPRPGGTWTRQDCNMRWQTFFRQPLQPLVML